MASAQNYRLEVGFMAGGSNYLGDIGGKFLPRRDFIADIKLRQTSLSGGMYVKYAISPRFALNLAGQFGRIRGDDSLTTNPGRHARNLSFRNDIIEASLTAEYEIYEAYNVGGNSRYRIDYSLYAILGAGFYMHDPVAEYNGGYIKLQPLQTERVNYSLSGISTILGFGMDFTLDRNYKIGFKLTTHTTNTDYLDDISTSYKPRSAYPNDNNGNLAYLMSDRRGEIDPTLVNDGNGGGPPRGNPNYDDTFIFATLNFAYVFKGKGAKYNRKFHNGYIRKKGRRLGVNRFFAF